MAEARRRVSWRELEERPLYSEPRRGFARALRQAAPAVIAEIKKASPSRGVIRPDFDPIYIASRYAAGGAAAVSVLTEERHFQGSLTHLEAVREAVPLPLLRKDFVFDPFQIVEARAAGADAILLIAAVLDDVQLRDLLAAAEDIGLDALVEVHTAAELERVLRVGAGMIGVNNRDLRTFHTSLETALALAPLLPPEVLAVAESGIEGPDDARRLAEVGYRAFLIGESLVREPDPAAPLRALLAGVR